MKLAIMQPYFLPYIGYFQLLAAVDKFVVFDDVHYINRGWINRNRLLLNGQAHTFTVPLRAASQNKLIYEIELADDDRWRDKLLRTLHQAYCKTPYYGQVSGLFDRVINYSTRQLDEFLLNSLREVTNYLALDVEIVKTSKIYDNVQLKGQERILDICRQEQTDIYINAIGGIELYDRDRFAQHAVSLRFLKSKPISYAQGKFEHLAWLSILDVIMFNSPISIRAFLSEIDFQ